MEDLNKIKEMIKELSDKVDTLCKEEQYKYPLFKRWKFDGKIVKFTGLREGEIVWKGGSIHSVGYKSAIFVAHTDEDWEDVAYDEERDLWDKQPVYGWHYNGFMRIICFYDAKNKAVFSSAGGIRKASYFNLYSPVEPDRYDKWLIELYKNLED